MERPAGSPLLMMTMMMVVVVVVVMHDSRVTIKTTQLKAHGT